MDIDISVNMYTITLKSSVSGSKLLFEGSMSQIFVLGFSFDLMSKIG